MDGDIKKQLPERAQAKQYEITPVIEQQNELTIDLMKDRLTKIKLCMQDVMKKGVDYGVIPGCGDKPTLLKPGAEKLGVLFMLACEMDIQMSIIDGFHREYQVKSKIIHQITGNVIACGVGLCSTMESKYRYRNDATYEITGTPIPRDAKENKKEYRRKGFGMKNIEGVWEWVKYKGSKKVENTDIADQWNTVLKMAKKRSYVDGILQATGASMSFTQDIEDIQDIVSKDSTDKQTKNVISPPPLNKIDKKLTETEATVLQKEMHSAADKMELSQSLEELTEIWAPLSNAAKKTLNINKEKTKRRIKLNSEGF